MTGRGSVVWRGLGWLGLLLLGLTGWAVDKLQGRTPIVAVAARLVLRCVTTVGSVVDRLPMPEVKKGMRETAEQVTGPRSRRSAT